LISRFNAGHGCILADEMGLGKTCQVQLCASVLILYVIFSLKFCNSVVCSA